MWKLAAGTLILLAAIVALTVMQKAHPGLDPHDQLAYEKQQTARRHDLLTSGATYPAALECAAGQVGRRTVQTLYVVWINQRSDLVTDADQDEAKADLGAKITACGSTVAALTNQAHDAGLELENQAALAMLKVGR